MPVIIRELVIRATVNDTLVNTTNDESSSGTITKNEQEREALIKECVEQVLEILDKRKENKTS